MFDGVLRRSFHLFGLEFNLRRNYLRGCFMEFTLGMSDLPFDFGKSMCSVRALVDFYHLTIADKSLGLSGEIRIYVGTTLCLVAWEYGTYFINCATQTVISKISSKCFINQPRQCKYHFSHTDALFSQPLHAKTPRLSAAAPPRRSLRLS